MAKEYFRTLSAVFPIILRREGGRTQILLHLRQNTGYMDGFWDVAGSGHVDGGETASQALCRECFEELGIRVRPQDPQRRQRRRDGDVLSPVLLRPRL